MERVYYSYYSILCDMKIQYKIVVVVVVNVNYAAAAPHGRAQSGCSCTRKYSIHCNAVWR